MPEAVESAKRQEEYKNLYTLVYRLIEAMERRLTQRRYDRFYNFKTKLLIKRL